MTPQKRKFVAYFYHPPRGWYYIQFGLHVSFWDPNIEIHIPFGFFRIGWIKREKTKLNENGEYDGAFRIGICE